MPKVAPLQGDFSGGEFSPLVYGRVNSERYATGLAVCKNYLPTIQGGLTRRPGSYFVAEVKDSSKETRIVPFEFSTTQAYIIEFGDEYLRFYRDYGQIVSGMAAYEIVSPYAEEDLFNLKFTQSADVLYIVHPDYAPRKLTRTGHTAWTLSTIDFLDGPYLSENRTSILPIESTATLTPGAATGSGVTLTVGPAVTITGAANNGSGLIRITAASHGYVTGDRIVIAGVVGTTEANGTWTITVISSSTFDLQGSTFANAYSSDGTSRPALFAATDVGRLIRIKEGSTWGWVKIASFVDAANITVDIQETLTNTNAKTTWRLGVWSGTTGYPSCVTFHEDRLCFAGVPDFPTRFDGSDSGDYENFAPSDLSGTVVSSNAIGFSLNSTGVNKVEWMLSDEKGLLAGTVAGEWVIRPSAQAEALSPTNISAKPTTSWGSANFQASKVGKGGVFIQRGGRKVREINYFFDVDGFRSTDLSILADHLTLTGVEELAYQKIPQSFMWMPRIDGVLLGMTYERDLDALKVGWHRHILGGVSDAAGSDAIVESAAVIPSSDGTSEDLWLVVRRFVDGGTVRYIEFLTRIFDDSIDQDNAFFVDCGLTYDNPLTITGITKASAAVVTSVAHGLSNGDRVKFKAVMGMTQINGLTATVANVTADTFEVNINSTNFSTYVSGGEVRELISTIAGLDHLEGQTVDILADGAVLPSQVVDGGEIELTVPSAIVHIGLGYQSDGQLLRLEAGSANGTSLGKTRRMHRVGMLFHRSLGIKIGFSFDELDQITFRTSSDPGSRPPSLFSGIISETVAADYDFENQFCWRQDQPLPSTILAIMPQMDTQDRG